MKKISILTFGFLVGCLVALSYAGDFEKDIKYQDLYLKPSKLAEISAQYFSPLNGNLSFTFQDSLTKEQRLAQLPGYKLPKRALFFSALIPGAGELYAKSYLKAAAFFLIEVSAWAFYGIYNNKGKQKEDEYQAFANEHWDPRKWYDWYANIDSLTQNLMTHASHMEELLEPMIKGEGDPIKTQQYYEMIGKYAEFSAGWEGALDDLTYEELLQYRRDQLQIADDYMKMRAKSNDLFEKARTGTTIAMLNHLLSAIDAAWTAKRHNNTLLEASLRFEQIYYVDHLQPVLSLKIKW
ncbi:MAG: hypothetical protein JSW07_15690 [bacterium]|nr:MAG: hypothetical protein JSW07_15690 [bacterium]